MKITYEAAGKDVNRRSPFLAPDLYSLNLHKTCATEAEAKALADRLNTEEALAP